MSGCSTVTLKNVLQDMFVWKTSDYISLVA